jgi:hypothetical protein
VDDWKVADTIRAEDVEENDVISFPQEEEAYVCTVVRSWEEDEDTITFLVDNEDTGDRGEVTVRWDDPVNVLVRNYDGVEV